MDKGQGHSLASTLRRQFLAGILVVLPLGATIVILLWIFQYVDGFLQPLFLLFLGRTLPGAGFVGAVILIYLVGLITSNVLGKRMVIYGQSLVARVPVVRPIYTTIKQISESFSKPGEAGFRETVLVEYPRKGMVALAFVTNETIDANGKKLLNLYVPTSPNPTSGFLQIVADEEVIHTGIPINEAMKSIISLGTVCHPEITALMANAFKKDGGTSVSPSR